MLSLTAFVLIERRVAEPMFRLPLFRIRAFTFGTLSTFLAAVARGGLMFMLIIWLQGIWLPQHGYDFTETPLWAGIYMLPLTVGMLLAGPTSGYLSDRFGARWFATGGMLGAALSFVLLLVLPTNFPYPLFAAALALTGISMGMFASPNRAAVMNSLPAGDRGAGGGMNQTFQNSAQVISIGIFFTLDDQRARRDPPAHDDGRARGPRRDGGLRAPRRRRPRRVDPLRGVPGLQPDRAPHGCTRAGGAERPRPRRRDGPLVLPRAHLGSVPPRPARGVRVRDRRLPRRGCGLAHARERVRGVELRHSLWPASGPVGDAAGPHRFGGRA